MTFCKSTSKLNTLFLSLGILLIPIITNAASFDCARASTFVEKTICTDNQLSLMDEELNTLYKEGQQNSIYATQRKKTQLLWLIERDKCNTEFSNDYQKSKCVSNAYESRIKDLKTLQEPKQPIFELIDKVSFQTYGGDHTISDNKIIFTNYDFRTRDKYQIIEVDPTDFTFRVLETTKEESTYIAHNEAFIVYKCRGLADTEELIIKNRKTNKTVVKKKFRDKIIWGEVVENNSVLIVQKTEIFMFDLNNLTTTKRHEFEMNSYVRNNKYSTYVSNVAKWGNNTVILTPDNLLIIDKDLSVVDTIEFGSSNSNRRDLVIADGKAVVSFEKDAKVFDLKTKKLLFSLQKPGAFVSYCTIDNSLVITAKESTSNTNAQVYDLNTGRLQLTIPLIASAIVYSNGKMLAYDYKYRGNSTLTLYKVDSKNLTKPDNISAQLKEAYKHAQETYAQTKDIYVVLEILENVNIEKYLLDKSSISEEEKVIFRQYGIWLSQTLDRFDKTKYVFDTAEINTNDKEVQEALHIARSKECYLMSTCKADEDDLKEIFGKLKIPNSKISIKMSTVDKLYFIDDKIYVSRYNERQIGTSIYNTNTLQHINDIFFAPDEHGEYQDNVTNVIDFKDNVILQMDARYDAIRDNFAVVSKQNSSLVCKGHTSVNIEGLSYENENICECLNSKTPYQEKTKVIDRIEVIKQTVKNNAIKLNRNEEVIETSKDYFITSTQWSEYKLNFYPFEKHSNESPKKSMRHTKLFVLEGTNKIIYSDFDINTAMKDKVKFSFYDISTNKDETLFYAKRIANQKYPHSITYKNLLIIGTGHELFFYDINKRKIVAYDKNFIEEPVLGHVDRNRIDKLHIYKDKLYVVTFNGENSRVVDLKKIAQ